MSEVQSFRLIVKDMVNDLLISFPELEQTIDADLQAIRGDEDDVEAAVDNIKLHCSKIFPKKFFEILYENPDMFTVVDGSCEFLPKIDYAVLWKENLSDKTRKTIWKYLQLLLFSSVAEVQDKSSFGEAADLFSAINDTTFKTKLEETMSGMKSLFTNVASGETKEPALPDVDEIHAHVSRMMKGKLGSLAKDIAEQTLNDMGAGAEQEGASVEDVFAKLIRDPTKLAQMIKSVGTRLDQKIKDGEIKESELLEEASDILKQMHTLPGMEHVKDMFKQMGVPNMSSAQNSHAAATMRKKAAAAKTRERMRAKLAERHAARVLAEAMCAQAQAQVQKDDHGTQVEDAASSTKKPSKKKKKKKRKK